MGKLRHQDVEAIYLEDAIALGFRHAGNSKFELGGFLSGVVRDRNFYIMEGCPLIDPYAIAFSKSEHKIDITDFIFKERKKLYEKYSSINGFVSVLWHSHPEVKIDGRVIPCDELSKKDITFIKKHSDSGLTLLLSTSDKRVAEISDEIRKCYFLFDPEKDSVFNVQITGFQVFDNSNVLRIPVHVVDSSYPYSLVEKFNSIRGEFRSASNDYFAKHPEEEGIFVREVLQYFQ